MIMMPIINKYQTKQSKSEVFTAVFRLVESLVSFACNIEIKYINVLTIIALC